MAHGGVAKVSLSAGVDTRVRAENMALRNCVIEFLGTLVYTDEVAGIKTARLGLDANRERRPQQSRSGQQE